MKRCVPILSGLDRQSINYLLGGAYYEHSISSFYVINDHRKLSGDLNTALHSLDDHEWSVKGHDVRLWAKRGHDLIPYGSNRVSYEQGVQVAWTVSAFHSLRTSLLI
jgi:hypothetical protein